VDTLEDGDNAAKHESDIDSPFAHSSIEYDLTARSDTSEVETPYHEDRETLEDGTKVAISSSSQCSRWSPHAEANFNDTTQIADANATSWTKLKAEAPAFKPATADTRFDAVTYAVYLAILSKGNAQRVNMDKGVQGLSPTLISAQLQSGSSNTARCYDAVHLARQVLEEITTRLGTVVLLSKRVQKEDSGYSLRSSIACIPCGKEDFMCWDLFKNGSCPRRGKCQWYHPQESDIGRVKVSIRCTEESNQVLSEEQLPTGSPAVRHKISLGDLVC